MASHKHPMAKWQAIRKQGFLRFILIRGALLWGICSAVFFSLMMLFMTDLPLASLLPKALLLFSLSGLVWGAIMWWVLERKYHQRMARSLS